MTEIKIKFEFVDHDKVILTNQNGDTYTSKSEGLMDFLHSTKPESLPAPTHDGTAEEVYNTIENARKFCKSEDIKTLGLARSMVAYAAPLRDEIAGLVQTIESHREQRELDRICYENKLTEANQRVKELEEKVQAKEVLLIGYRDLTEGMI